MNFEHIGVLESSAPRTESGFTPGGAVFMSRSASGRDFIVLVENAVCYDDMSGRPYPKTVRVFTEGRHFHGCGGDTEDLLTGGDWAITAVGPYYPSTDSGLTITFDAEGRVSGYGGCNRFTGSYELGEGIDFGPIAATRRACADREAGEREHMLFTLLDRVIAFEIGDDGELLLMAQDGPVIEAVHATTP
jgi:heat shock protein HslJ